MPNPSKLFIPLLISVSTILFPASIYAQEMVECVDKEGQIVNCNQGFVPITSLETIFANVLNVITILAGFAVLLMLVIGAFRYMTAQGDPKAVGAARSTITWALVGLFFIIAAWFVILFISQFTGLNLTEFCINLPFDIDRCELQIDS